MIIIKTFLNSMKMFLRGLFKNYQKPSQSFLEKRESTSVTTCITEYIITGNQISESAYVLAENPVYASICTDYTIPD